MKRGDIYGHGDWLKVDQSTGTLAMAGNPRQVNATVVQFDMAEHEDGSRQRVLVFAGDVPKLGLNATNWDFIADGLGIDDDDEWPLPLMVTISASKLDRPYQGKKFGVRITGVSVPGGTAGSPPAAASNPFAAPPAQMPFVEPLGEAWAAAAMHRLTGDGNTLDDLRSVLSAGGVPRETIAGDMASWPKSLVPAISDGLTALKNPETLKASEIPW